MEQYRSLSLEAEKFETHNHQLESESSNLRLELITRENEARRLRERIEMMETDIKDVRLLIYPCLLFIRKQRFTYEQ